MSDIFKEKFNRKLEFRLYKSYEQGIFDNSLFKKVLDRDIRDIDRFEKFLMSDNYMIKLSAIDLMGKFKKDLAKLVAMLKDENESIGVKEKIIRVLGDRGICADVMSEIMEEDSQLLITLVENIIRQNKHEFLTDLLFSDNRKLSDFIARKVKEIK